MELNVLVREGTHIKGFWEDKNKICGIITREGEHIGAKIVVVATGANLSSFDLKKRSYPQMVTYMGRYENTTFEKNIAYVIYDKDFLPLCGWMFPEADNLVNIGVGMEMPSYSKGKITKYFERISSMYLNQYMENSRLIGTTRGFPIRYTYRIKDIVDRNVLYVGEAGRVVNAFTGEGISQALVCGKLAAHTISKYFNNKCMEELIHYEKMVRKEYRVFPWFRLVKSFINYKHNWRIIEAFQGKEGNCYSNL